MSRPKRTQLDYFPFDTDFFDDDKIQLVEAEFGCKGSYVAIRLLCKVYRNGWFYQWGEDECLLLTRQMGAGFVPSMVDEVVKGLVRRSLFDKGVFDSFRVLTSTGIQRRYTAAVRQMGRSLEDCITRPEIWLLEGEKKVININSGIKADNSGIKADNSGINHTKERKGKEKKRESECACAHTLARESLNQEFEKRILEDEMKLEAIAANTGMKEDEVRAMVPSYARWLSITERRPATFGAFCSTFFTWIHYEKQGKNGKQREPNDRKGEIDISLNRPEDYRD